MSNEDINRGQGRAGMNNDTNISFGKNYLLVIGIDDYKNAPILRNAVRDAKAFKDLLIKSYLFEEETTYVLFNEEATKSNIFRIIGELIRDKVKQDDSLVFYFSGHGEYVDYLGEGFWLPVDAVEGDHSTYLSNYDVLKLMNRTQARHVLGIVDSCFSGSFIMRSSSQDQLIKRMISKPSRWIITSGQLEVVSDGSLGDHSPFAKLLLSRLTNNPDKGLWVSKLGEGIREGFSFNTKKQFPDFAPLLDAGHEGGQFVFLRKNVDWSFAMEAEITDSKLDQPNRNSNIDQDRGQNNEENITISVPDKDWKNLPLDELQMDLELMLANDEVERVFNILFRQLKSSSRTRKTLITRIGEFRRLGKLIDEGVEDHNSLRRQYNSIRSTFSKLVQNLEEEDLRK